VRNLQQHLYGMCMGGLWQSLKTLSQPVVIDADLALPGSSVKSNKCMPRYVQAYPPRRQAFVSRNQFVSDLPAWPGHPQVGCRPHQSVLDSDGSDPPGAVE
jgi:hypothetical protein